MEAVLETGIPDLNKSMGTSLDGKNITPATLVADITSDYEWIYANYEALRGTRTSTTSTRPTSTRTSPPSCASAGNFWTASAVPVLDEAQLLNLLETGEVPREV